MKFSGTTATLCRSLLGGVALRLGLCMDNLSPIAPTKAADAASKQEMLDRGHPLY